MTWWNVIPALIGVLVVLVLIACAAPYRNPNDCVDPEEDGRPGLPRGRIWSEEEREEYRRRQR